MASATKTADRRRSERKSHLVQAFLCSPTATDPSERIEVAGVNLSRHGVAFEYTAPLAEATYHLIEFEMGGQVLKTEVRIVSCRSLGKSRYQIGAEFF